MSGTLPPEPVPRRSRRSAAPGRDELTEEPAEGVPQGERQGRHDRERTQQRGRCSACHPGPLGPGGRIVLGVELRVGHGQVEDALNQAGDGGNARPEEEQVDDAPTDLAEIELVYSQAAKQNAEEAGGNFASPPSLGGGRDDRELTGAGIAIELASYVVGATLTKGSAARHADSDGRPVGMDVAVQ